MAIQIFSINNELFKSICKGLEGVIKCSLIVRRYCGMEKIESSVFRRHLTDRDGHVEWRKSGFI